MEQIKALQSPKMLNSRATLQVNKHMSYEFTVYDSYEQFDVVKHEESQASIRDIGQKRNFAIYTVILLVNFRHPTLRISSAQC